MPSLLNTAQPRCDECGTLLHRGSQPRNWTYKGRTLTADQPGWYCGVEPHHEPVYDEPDIEATEGVFLELRAEVDGTLAPAEVQRIRRRLGLSQREAGRVLGGGPMAFHKYEKGEIAMTRSGALLLRLLDRHPELLVEIVGQRAA
jgi:HTH-type transcriptional regulator/antitoxin MqsA